MNTLSLPTVNSLVKKLDVTSNPVDAYQLAVQAEAVALKKKDAYEIASIQLILTKILINNGAHQEALKKNYSALQFFSQAKEEHKLAKCWKYNAQIYGYLGNTQKQLAYNEKCLSIVEQLEEPIEKIKILNNIGHTYFELQEYDKAEALFKANLESPNLTEDLYAVSLKNLGKVFFKKGEYNKAKTTFKITTSIAKKYNLPLYINASNYFLGAIYFEEEQYEKAISFIQESVQGIEEKKYLKKELLMQYKLLIQCLIKLERTKEVDGYFDKYLALSDLITKQRKDQAIKNLQFQLEINEVEKERASLAEKNKQLQEANQIIERQTQELQNCNQELSEFAHRIAHDIKQPIRTIHNFVGLFEKELKGTMTERATEFMQFITSATKDVTQFIDDILEYASSDQSQQPTKLVDCNMVIENVKSNLAAQLQETNGRILYDKLPTIPAHESLLVQIFQNLISNAIKFRRRDVPPLIKIRGMEDATQFIFEIEDNGIGIKQEDQERVFQLFTRLHRKADIEGSGIGLSTVSKILKRYNASIEVSSIYGKGSTFRLLFPKRIIKSSEEEMFSYAEMHRGDAEVRRE